MLKFTKIYNTNNMVCTYSYDSDNTSSNQTSFKSNYISLDKKYISNENVISNIIKTLSINEPSSYYEVDNYDSFDIIPSLYWIHSYKKTYILTSLKIRKSIRLDIISSINIEFLINESCKNTIFILNGEVEIYINEYDMYNYLLDLNSIQNIEVFCKREYLKERILSLR